MVKYYRAVFSKVVFFKMPVSFWIRIQKFTGKLELFWKFWPGFILPIRIPVYTVHS